MDKAFIDTLAPEGGNLVYIVGESTLGHDAVRVQYASTGYVSTISSKHIQCLDCGSQGYGPSVACCATCNPTAAQETHTVESWCVNFRGERVVTTPFAGTLGECRDWVAQQRNLISGAGWGYSEHHLAIRRLSDERVTEHTGREGFNHGKKTARFV